MILRNAVTALLSLGAISPLYASSPVVTAVPSDSGVLLQRAQSGYGAKDIYSECLEKPMSPAEFAACVKRVDSARNR